MTPKLCSSELKKKIPQKNPATKPFTTAGSPKGDVTSQLYVGIVAEES